VPRYSAKDASGITYIFQIVFNFGGGAVDISFDFPQHHGLDVGPEVRFTNARLAVIEPLQILRIATPRQMHSINRAVCSRVAVQLTRAQVEYHPQFFTGFQIVDKKKHHPPTTPSHALLV
jgi:hypothetical protein